MIDRDIHIPCLLCPTCFSGTFIHSYSVSKFNAVVFAKEVFTVRLLHHGHPINNNNNNNNNNNSSSGSNSNKGTGQNNYTRTGLTFRGGGGRGSQRHDLSSNIPNNILLAFKFELAQEYSASKSQH